jgi:hypothetical protein
MGRTLVSLVLCGGAVLAGARGGATPTEAAAPAAQTEIGDAAARRRRELEVLQRQDAAAALAAQFGVNVDWRSRTLEELLDIRLRAAKAAELRARFGISVDWRRYSWDRMEAVCRALAGLETPAPTRRSVSPDSDAVIAPTFAARRPAAGDARDPDAVIAPTFAAHARWRAGQDPDGLMAPTFSRPARALVARVPSDDPDALLTPPF